MAQVPYDAIAEWYDRYVQDQPLYRKVILPNLLSLVGDGREQAVCNLACGQGLVTRELAQRGAKVTGVDVSEKLLALARGYEATEPMGIQYVVDDAQVLMTLSDASVDGVTCSMALMDIPDLAACFHAVRRIVRPDGWFVLCITHLCFETPHARWRDRDGGVSREVQGYFVDRFWQGNNPAGVRGQVGAWHRMLSTYVNTLVKVGLVPEHMLEPSDREVPCLLLMRAWARRP